VYSVLALAKISFLVKCVLALAKIATPLLNHCLVLKEFLPCFNCRGLGILFVGL